jgi:hypothetical protein
MYRLIIVITTIENDIITSWNINYLSDKLVQIKELDLDICPVCLVTNSSIITNCKHIFCETCINKCCEDTAKCPMCRSVITDMFKLEII